MKQIIVIIILGTFFNKMTHAQCRLDKTNYQLVFEDNFDTYTNLTQLKTKWDLLPRDRWYGTGDWVDENNSNIHSEGEYYEESQVSLQPGGILRLSATKMATPITCTLSNGKIRKPIWKSGMIMSKDISASYFDTPAPYTGPIWNGGTNMLGGWRKGMFELRCKVPQPCNFAAYWLWGGYSEIDIFETGGDPNANQFMTTQHFQGTTSADLHCSNFFRKMPAGNLSDDFHTYTCVWTPTKVTIFFDNREVITRDATLIPAYDQLNWLMVNLGMWNWCGTNTFMDIDYIKVYKPIGGNYSLPYKSANDFMNNSIFSNSSILKVSPTHGSISSNPTGNKIYFVNQFDNRMYVSEKINGIWQTNIIQYNYNPNLPAMLCNGDLTFNPQFNKILYKGKDNRIQFFELYPNNVYMHYFIDDYFSTTAYNISSNPGSMSVTNDGKIVYRGIDNKIHIFKWNSAISRWDQLIINYTYGLCAGMPDADFVAGDVIVEQNTNNIIYRGRDGRLQLFWQSSPFVYQHGWIDPNWNQFVSNKPGSIISTPKGIFYRGTDDKLHRFYWNGSTMIHQVANYTYGLCAGMPDADLVNGSLSYLPSFNYVLYIGRDGRVQRFAIPSINTSTAWGHYWIDDYWNTSDFITYGSATPNNYASLHTTSDEKMVYIKPENGLQFFKFEPCEYLNPACGTTKNIRKVTNPTPVSMIQNSLNVTVYPNPSSNSIQLVSSNNYEPISYEIFDIQGVCVLKKTQYSKNSYIDISNLSNGIYIIRSTDGRSITNSKFTKQ